MVIVISSCLLYWEKDIDYYKEKDVDYYISSLHQHPPDHCRLSLRAPSYLSMQVVDPTYTQQDHFEMYFSKEKGSFSISISCNTSTNVHMGMSYSM